MGRIVSHQALLIRIPRTGTGSMGEMLGVNDSHKTARDLKKQMGTTWDELFKFAFVRDPYTRYQSAWVATGCDIEYGDINENLRYQIYPELMKRHAVFFRPQVDYVTNEDEKIMIDFIGRFEKLHIGWKYVLDKIGLKVDRYPHKDKAERPYDKLTDLSKKILYEIYEKDFELFGYNR